MPNISHRIAHASNAPLFYANRFIFAALFTLVCACLSSQAATARPNNPQATPMLALIYDEIAPKLTAGNIFIYLVPFSTQGSDDTSQPNWWKNCVYTSPLSTEGVTMARTIYTTLASLRVTIGFVNSGEYCTALTSTTFVTGRAGILHVTPDLDPVAIQRKIGVLDGVIEQRVLSYFRGRIPDTITINMGTKLTPTTAPHPVMTDLVAGETAIFEVAASGELLLLAKLNWRQWAEMGQYISRKTAGKGRMKGNINGNTKANIERKAIASPSL